MLWLQAVNGRFSKIMGVTGRVNRECQAFHGVLSSDAFGAKPEAADFSMSFRSAPKAARDSEPLTRPNSEKAG